MMQKNTLLHYLPRILAVAGLALLISWMSLDAREDSRMLLSDTTSNVQEGGKS
ncbi:MAG: hypothetical protein ACPGN3_18190 [Opitutales bacterium]